MFAQALCEIPSQAEGLDVSFVSPGMREARHHRTVVAGAVWIGGAAGVKDSGFKCSKKLTHSKTIAPGDERKNHK